MFQRDLLESCAVGVTSVVVRDDVRSGNAIIQNDASGDNCIVLYPGANRAIDRDFVDQVLDGYGKGDWLLLQNEISELPYIVSRAKARGKVAWVDAFFEYLSDSFRPLLGVLLGGSLIIAIAASI